MAHTERREAPVPGSVGAVRVCVAIAFVVALLGTTAPARAWYFPEHVVLSQDGQAFLAPELQAVLGTAVAEARRDGLTLCERTDQSLDALLIDTPLRTKMIRTPQSVPCVPYSALSGLAADHASDVGELRTLLADRKRHHAGVGGRLRMAPLPRERAARRALAGSHVVRARARRRALFPRSRLRTARAGDPRALPRCGPQLRDCAPRCRGGWAHRRRPRPLRVPSSALAHPRAHGSPHRRAPRSRVRRALPAGRLRVGSPRQEQCIVGRRPRRGALAARRVQRRQPPRAARDGPPAVRHAGERRLRAGRPHAVLDDHGGRLSVAEPRRDRSPARGRCARADTTAMRPEGHLDHGWAIQIFAAAGAMVLLPRARPSTSSRRPSRSRAASRTAGARSCRAAARAPSPS